MNGRSEIEGVDSVYQVVDGKSKDEEHVARGAEKSNQVKTHWLRYSSMHAAV